ncbi:MAG: cobyric acid synthase, partial [Halanaerobiales bacterium]
MDKEKCQGSIMLQGTSSNVGKSVLAAALCRILSRDGCRVAPFKSWNMSLNSIVTAGGGEIGIAQAIQAEAAGIEPTVDMQPLLIKPEGNGRTQKVIRGRPILEEMDNFIEQGLEIIEESYRRLQNSYDVLVVEGAGSPVEMNVRERDLANMKVALMDKIPVVLVADIDRGGALASVVGTLTLLPAAEKRLVKGIIINRFRGDYEILRPGIEFLEEHTGKPVLGVIPYLSDIKLPEEDAVAIERRKNTGSQKKTGKLLQIRVVRLPRISNFTDFAALAREPDVKLEYVTKPEDLSGADLIIIPGSKNTISDLNFLRQSGLFSAIREKAGQNKQIAGICGGFQMLGRELRDPEKIEGDNTSGEGLDLLPMRTVFSAEKKTNKIKGRIIADRGVFKNLAGEQISGYEIHMGQTNFIEELSPLFRILSCSGSRQDYPEGAINEQGNVWGTYLHGLFNNNK